MIVVTMLRMAFLRRKLRSRVNICKYAITDAESIFEGKNYLGPFSSNTHISMGYGSSVGPHCNLSFCKIGRFCSIGPDVKVISGVHPVRDYVSTNQLFYSSNPTVGESFNVTDFVEQKYAESDGTRVVIGNDVFIGEDARLFSGIKIGDGAVVASSACVTADVPPYSIVGGVPAKIIRYRFTEDQIRFLLSFKWWEKNLAWIKENSKYFSNISEFISKFKEC